MLMLIPLESNVAFSLKTSDWMKPRSVTIQTKVIVFHYFENGSAGIFVKFRSSEK